MAKTKRSRGKQHSPGRQSLRSGPHVRLIRLDNRRPPVTVEGLALMLELDLLLGRRNDCLRRLQSALDAAARRSFT